MDAEQPRRWSGKPRRRRAVPRTVRNRALVKFRYRPQHGVIVICSGEAHQRRVYEQLNAAGLECRVVVV